MNNNVKLNLGLGLFRIFDIYAQKLVVEVLLSTFSPIQKLLKKQMAFFIDFLITEINSEALHSITTVLYNFLDVMHLSNIPARRTVPALRSIVLLKRWWHAHSPHGDVTSCVCLALEKPVRAKPASATPQRRITVKFSLIIVLSIGSNDESALRA